MKQGWEIKKLGEVCEKITDGSHNPPKGVVESDYPMLSSKNIIDDSINYEDPRFLTEKDFLQENKRTQVSPGDVLLTIVGTIGRTAIVPEIITPFTLQRSVAVLKTNRSKLYPRFLMYSLQNSISDLVSEARGVAQKGLYLKQIKELPILLPTLPEQHRIVSILDKTFAAIAQAKANAEQNLKNAKEVFESYLQGVFEKKGEGWEEKKLSEVLLKTETVDPTKKPDEEFIYLDVSSVNKETKEIENATVLLGKDAPSRARKLVKTNDIIFATVRPTHSRVALITEEYNNQVCSTGYFVLRAKEFLNNNLVFYFLLTCDFNKQMEKLQKGASYPAVTDSEVKGIYITYPKSLSEQQSIVQRLDALSAETKRLEAIYQQKVVDLEELKKSLLQKAFNGEL